MSAVERRQPLTRLSQSIVSNSIDAMRQAQSRKEIHMLKRRTFTSLFAFGLSLGFFAGAA